MRRNEIEAVLAGWHQYEVQRGGAGVIDYDCRPARDEVEAAPSRYDVLARLLRLADGLDADLAETLAAHVAYLRARLGQNLPFTEYVTATQGCGVAGWPPEHLDEVHGRAVESLERLGISWNEKTTDALEHNERPLSVDETPAAIESAAGDFEASVRRICGTAAPFSVSIEDVEVDQYWSYWLDGHGSTARLRLNRRRAKYTEVQARQFALHEVLGHALQSASYADRCAQQDVPWVRLLAVHAPHQVLLEGLAQALPLFVAPEDSELAARVRLDHFHVLVHAELHQRTNNGDSVEDCVRFALSRVPYWTAERVGDLLSDRGSDPLLRSYLWAYPAGLDWFAALADRASRVVHEEVLRAAYRDPLTPQQLSALWPAGPAIGGPGRKPVRVRESPVP